MLRPETKELITAWTLGAYGAARSLREFADPHPELRVNQSQEELKSALPAILALGVFVTGYDLVAPRRQRKTITAEVHHGLDTHTALTAGTILTLTGHLFKLIPDQYDPIHLGGRYLRDKIYGS